MSWPLNRQGIVILGLSLCTLLPPSPQTKSRGRGEGWGWLYTGPFLGPIRQGWNSIPLRTLGDLRHPDTVTSPQSTVLTATPPEGVYHREPVNTNLDKYIFKKTAYFFYTNFKRVNKRIHWFRVHRRPISVKKKNNNNIRYAVSNCPGSCGLCLNYLRHI